MIICKFEKGTMDALYESEEYAPSMLLTVSKDLRTGAVYVTHNAREKHYKVLAKFTIWEVIHKVGLKTFEKSVFAKIKSAHICKCTVLTEYGKRVAESVEPILYGPNPYYHCAGDMVIYDRDMVEYYVKLHPEQMKRTRKQTE